MTFRTGVRLPIAEVGPRHIAIATGAPSTPLRHDALLQSPMSYIRLKTQRGFTMIELVLVVTVLGIMIMLSIPRIKEMSARSSLRAARQELTAAFASARTAAFQKGKTSTLTLASNQANVTVLSGLAGSSIQVFGPIKLDRALNVSLTALDGAPTSMNFDSRGLVTPTPLGAVNKYRLTYQSYADTLCVSAAGIILPRNCQL